MTLRFMKFKLILLLILANITGYSQNSEQPQNATATLDTPMIMIGDHFTLQIDVEWVDSTFIQFPVFTDTLIKNIEILRDLPFDTIRGDAENIIIRKRYLLTSFDSGYYHINPLPVTLRPKSDETYRIYTNSLFLAVQTIHIDSAETRIADIKGTIHTPLTFKEFVKEYLPIILIIIVVAILVLAIIYLIKKNKKPTVEQEIIVPKEEAHVIAFRDLDALSAKKLWQTGFVKNYYSDLSDIMRRYLENRYEMPAMESSTTEITEYLKSNKFIDKELRSKLQEFLETADLVKFAKFEPIASEHLKYLEQSYAFVLKTKVVEEVEQEKDKDELSDEKTNKIQ